MYLHMYIFVELILDLSLEIFDSPDSAIFTPVKKQSSL